MYKVIQDDAFDAVNYIKDTSIDLAFVDPPLTIGKKITLRYKENFRNPQAITKKIAEKSVKVTHELMVERYNKTYKDFYCILYDKIKADGCLFTVVHNTEYIYARVLLDQIFGAENCLNDIIWAYDYGVVTKSRWAVKHSHILWYVKDTQNYTFNYNKILQISYPNARKGLRKIKNPVEFKTDVWHYPVIAKVPEHLGFTDQRPLAMMNRIAKIHTEPNDVVYDFFAGSGSFGLACWLQGCEVNLVEVTTHGCNVINRRFAKYGEVYFGQENEKRYE